jgi:hypothetical protein
MEGRPPVKGKARQLSMPWTQSQVHGMPAVLERIRQAGKRQRKARRTTLLPHISNVAHLREASLALPREAAPGVEGTAGTGSVPGHSGAAGLGTQARRTPEPLRRARMGR